MGAGLARAPPGLEYQTHWLSVRVLNPAVTCILHQKCTRVSTDFRGIFRLQKNLEQFPVRGSTPPRPHSYNTPNLTIKLRL